MIVLEACLGHMKIYAFSLYIAPQLGGLFPFCAYNYPNSSGIQAGVYAKIDTHGAVK